MDSSTIIQIIACALTTLCGIGAIVVAIWTVHESQRPQPVAFLEHDRDKSSILLIVKNFGSGVATDIVLEGFDYDMVSEELAENVRKSFVGRGIPALVPGAQRDTVISAGPAGLNARCELSCTVTVKYSEKGLRSKLKQREESFVLDFYSFSKAIYSMSDEHDIASAVKHIDTSLGKTIPVLESIAKSLKASER